MRIFLFLVFSTSFLTAQMKVLHYDETTGYDHNTRNVSLAFFKSMEAELGMTVTQDSDGSEFTMAKMATYDLVVFSNTSGNTGLTASQQAALEWFIDTKGGGLIGIHAASDTYRHSTANGGKTGDWDWYAETIGGSVQTGPNHTNSNHVNQITEITTTPVTQNLNFPWEKEEEYYYWENGYLNSDMTETLRVGDTGGNTYDDPRPVAWQRTNSAGSRIFYTSLGHKTQNFSGSTFPQFKQMLKDATLWTLGASQTVPVELTSFNVTKDEFRNNAIIVGWETSSEINSDFFVIQKADDRKNWTSIAEISAAGSSNKKESYSYTDRDPCLETCYYRLKSVDLNGSFEYSSIRQLENESADFLSIVPNPMVDQATVLFKENVKSGILRVVDIDGRIILTNSIKDVKLLSIKLGPLPSGVFYIEIVSENVRHLEKVIKL